MCIKESENKLFLKKYLLVILLLIFTTVSFGSHCATKHMVCDFCKTPTLQNSQALIESFSFK